MNATRHTHDHAAPDHAGHGTPDHTGHGAAPAADHGAHAEMDHSAHAGMDHDAHAGIEHSAHAADDHGGGHGGHGGHIDHSGHEQMFRNRFWVSLVLSLPVIIYSPMLRDWLGYSVPDFPGSGWIIPGLAVVIFFYGGVPFLQMARGELAQRRPGMMMLISLAISVAFVYSVAALLFDWGESFFWELVTLIDVMLLGHWVEMHSVRQASGALDELARLMPDSAERLTDSGTETVPVSRLRPGDLVLVRPGAAVPADGTVVDGRSDVNEALITGESTPVTKEEGARVIGGSVNGDGSLRVRVTATGDETALSGIMRLVREAQASKTATQVLADKAAGWLFYAALAAAAVTFIAWLIAVGWDIEVMRRVVAVLVIACPHALGLAVPLVVAITTSLAANNGILIRDRAALELARELDAVIFDKTGTLTKGEQGVVDSVVAADADDLDGDAALALAAAVEQDSEHMVARAIRDAAAARGLTLPTADGFTALKGRGVRATVAGTTVHVGGPQLLEELGVAVSAELTTFATAAGDDGHSVVYLVRDGRAVAAFATADVIRPESVEAVRRLRDAGIEVAMLTGDSHAVAQSVARRLGIETVFAQVLPEDKDKKVSALQQQGKKVAMVGDGINDAPALTRADVGIAIGSGTDVAVESAGIILVNSNPLDVVRLLTLSRASRRKMVQNLWWAAGYNIIAIPLAAGALAPVGITLPIAVGALVMSLSTVIVAVNAQLLRRVAL